MHRAALADVLSATAEAHQLPAGTDGGGSVAGDGTQAAAGGTPLSDSDALTALRTGAAAALAEMAAAPVTEEVERAYRDVVISLFDFA